MTTMDDHDNNDVDDLAAALKKENQEAVQQTIEKNQIHVFILFCSRNVVGAFF